MKFAAVILFACLAVSNAAFTANLVQRAQPALNQAMFKLRLATGRADDNGLQTSLFQQLQQEANDLMEQISAATSQGMAVASEVTQHLSDVVNQMQSLASSAASSVVDIVSSFWNNLTGSLFGGKGRSGLFSGLIDNVAVAINGVLAQTIQHAQNLVAQLNLPNLLNQALNNLFSQITGRGIFGNLFGSIAEAGSNAWNAITSIFSSAVSVAGDSFNAVQAMATEFVTEAAQNIHGITTDAANDFLAFLKPYQQDLGTLYDQVAGVVSQIGNF
jgi:predicted PurR-regulated permease PerM